VILVDVNNQNTQQKLQDVLNKNRNSKIQVKRFIFAGGGTGGHIYPAVGIAQALQRLYPEIDLVFIGGHDRLESTLVPQQGFHFLPIAVEGFPRSLTLKWITVIIKVCQGVMQSLKYLKELKPDVVIGTGGYVSGPVLFAAWLMDIPIAIQEQNVSPGLTNSILARWAKAAYLALPPNTQRFPEHIIQITGNPIRPGITDHPRNDETYKKYNLSPYRKTVFVMGGSQGARAINEAMIDACPLISMFDTSIERKMNRDSIVPVNNSYSCKIQIVHQTGKSQVEEVRDAYDQHGIPHHVQSFFDTVEEIYSITDVMICRAGGMTVSEVTACGIPAIFIPLPAAIGNNQVTNAKSVANAGAAVVLEQDMFTPDVLVEQLFNILTKEETYQQMRTASENLGRPFACDTIAKSLYKLTE